MALAATRLGEIEGGFVVVNGGRVLAEPFLQLAFLALPVIPALKITDRGMVDVTKFELIA
jgi:adenine deaminase